jgi:hypothetical protein
MDGIGVKFKCGMMLNTAPHKQVNKKFPHFMELY